MKRRARTSRRGRRHRVCDVGTGSGCIAVAVAHTQPTVRVVAIDVSAAALRVAAANAQRHGVAARLDLVASDLFAALPETARFDVIVSNPPYLGAGESAVRRRSPGSRAAALWAGRDGLQVIERLVGAAPARLRPGGLLAVEIGAGQAPAVLALAARAGFTTCAGAPRPGGDSARAAGGTGCLTRPWKGRGIGRMSLGDSGSSPLDG